MVILNLKSIDIPNLALVSLCIVTEKLASVKSETNKGYNLSLFLLLDEKLFFMTLDFWVRAVINKNNKTSPPKPKKNIA